MRGFLEWTMWEMETPKSYGAFHIIASIILFAIAMVVAWKLKNTNEKQNKIVLGISGGMLLLFEVYKIAVHVVLDPYGWGGFWGVFPFQLCSLPMYLGIVCAICSNKKVNSWLYEFMFAINMFGGMMAFFEPSGINHPYITLTLHAYIWHMTLVFIGLYLYMSKRACNNNKDYYKALIVYYSSCILAQIFNIAFQSKGVNCFYISPFKRSPLAVFSSIYANFGWFANMVLLLLGISIAAGIIYYVGYAFRKKKEAK